MSRKIYEESFSGLDRIDDKCGQTDVMKLEMGEKISVCMVKLEIDER